VTVVTDGATWTGVTSKIRRLTVDRGRKHELDRVEPGTAQVEFDNRDGWLDPSVNAAVRPMLPIRLFTGRGWRTPSGSPTPGGGVFSGWIERFTYNREPLRPDEASVTVDCVDSLGLLARPFPDVSIGKRKLHRVKADDGNGWVMSYKPQTVGRRIADALYDADFPPNLIDDSWVGNAFGNDDRFGGATIVQRATYDLSSSPGEVIGEAMDALLPVVSTFFATGDGMLTFRDRAAYTDSTSSEVSSGSRIAAAANPEPLWALFDDGGLELAQADPIWATVYGEGNAEDLLASGIAIPISDLEVTIDELDVINSCLCYPQGVPEDALADYLWQDLDSIARFGRRSHDLPNLPILKAHDVERAGFEWLPVYGAEMCKRYAKFIVGNYKEPRPRVRRLVVSRRMDGDEAGDLPLTVGGSWPVWDFIRFVELGNVVRIYSLSETGSKINGSDWFVEGLHHVADASISAQPLAWTLELDVSPVGYWTQETGAFTSAG
jgi:hypothetical protein